MSRAAGLSQSALVWREYRQHPLAVLAALIIFVLFGLSVFAPLLANDRPLYYSGYNRFEYQELARSARAALNRMTTLPAGTERAAAQQNLQSLLDQLRVQLPESATGSFDGWTTQVQTALAAPQLDATTLRTLTTRLRQEFSSPSITLRSVQAWPGLAALTWGDVWVMTAYLLLMFSPLFWWLLSGERTRRWRGKALFWGGILIPAMCALIWGLMIPSRVDRTPYKQGQLAAAAEAQTSPVVYEAVLWPVVPYGIDEDDLAGKSAEPAMVTWLRPWLPAGVLKFVGSSQPPAVAADASSTSPWNQPHWLGTDEIGRDLACRMLWGGRVSLSVGLVAVSIYTAIGIVVGALAGYFRGLVDLLVSRVIEVVICFPAFFLILTIVVFVGPSIFNIMIIIGLTGWTGVARLVRGEFLRLVDLDFVQAGRVLGYSPLRIIFRHVLPNALAPVLVSATFGVAGAILTESGLSFLGLGITVPTPSWGSIMASGRDAIFRAPWIILLPGVAIFVTITCYNLIGETLRDASDPRLRGSR